MASHCILHISYRYLGSFRYQKGNKVAVLDILFTSNAKFAFVFKTFDELMSVASTGDHKNIHKTGADLKSAGTGSNVDVYADFPNDMVLFSFGKANNESRGMFNSGTPL